MFALTLTLALTLPLTSPQDEGGFPGTGVGHQPRVEIPWNRYYDVGEIYALLDRLAAEWPDLLSHEVIGHSVEGREIRVYTLNDPESWHFMRAGPNGAIVSEYATYHNHVQFSKPGMEFAPSKANK